MGAWGPVEQGKQGIQREITQVLSAAWSQNTNVFLLLSDDDTCSFSLSFQASATWCIYRFVPFLYFEKQNEAFILCMRFVI